MPRVAFCPAGHDQNPVLGNPTQGLDANGKVTTVRSVISGIRKDRPGRCHRCGAVLQYHDVPEEEDA